MFGEFDEASIKVVIRNSKGEVMATLSEKIKKPPTMDILELLAAKRAMYFSLEISFTKFVFEGDAESLIKSLKYGGWEKAQGGWEKAQGGHLIKDIFAFVNSFQSISFSHVVRQGNAVTHALAQRARHSFPLTVWMESVPQDVASFVLSDFQFHK
ncbi:uncharacterized protein LOC142635406 [Castanea sativa]|uniref:uncharacterized protein LOC142635406 n=1 Tax=Castanea sativa TaxID=21020 RepID=UPI003F64DE4B